jgi:hypothetical protein
MPVGNEVMGDSVKPGRKGNAAICIVLNVVHCPLKDAGSQILRVMEVPRSIVDIVEDAVEITLIEQTKCVTVAL